uniref:Progonadoliberin n=1 Tax=Leptobrachium leishanense TaxID=445787 RepID=A0A8C5PHN5_9ANUR
MQDSTSRSCHFTDSESQTHPLTPQARMKPCGTSTLLLLVLLYFDHICYAQHWSYGLRPGGKRVPETLQDSYSELFPACWTIHCVAHYPVGPETLKWLPPSSSLQGDQPSIKTPNEVALFTEPQRLECSIPQTRLSVMKEALMSWLDGENQRKKL